ncbi:hypothetical protein GYMLUDRAFT_33865 [Collybiopsis luxurians FD-317 M1]|nr:hypothetical protein GYMLUDRAFT_33865 [Collybiopsis luxurians FD-317 M1]
MASNTGTIFFYGQTGQFGYMSNFYPEAFTAPDPAQWLPVQDILQPPVYSDPSQTLTFLFSEQYFMYCKALQFDDREIADRIMEATKPAQCKALGRKSNFDEEVWVNCRTYIMEEALWWKFGGGMRELAPSTDLDHLGRKLLKTGQNRLVEAAGRDRVWGIGYTVNQQPEKYEHLWGKNYLGLTLEKVRARIRVQEEEIKAGKGKS